MTQTLETLYSQLTGHAPESVEALPGAGSNRSYYRLKGTPTLIGVCGTSREENEAFIYLSRHFQAQHLPVPDRILLATSLANPISCVTRIIVVPSSARDLIVFSTSPTSSGSNADVGSSNNTTFGFTASALAIPTLCSV